MQAQAKPSHVHTAIGGGLVGPQSLSEQAKQIATDVGFATHVHTLRSVQEAAAKGSQAIKNDPDLSQEGRDKRRKATGSDAAKMVLETTQGIVRFLVEAHKEGGQVFDASPVNFADMLKHVGGVTKWQHPFGQNQSELLNRTRDALARMDASDLANTLRRAAEEGDTTTVYAAESMGAPWMSDALFAKAGMDEASRNRWRINFRTTLHPETAARIEALDEVGAQVVHNSFATLSSIKSAGLILELSWRSRLEALLEPIRA